MWPIDRIFAIVLGVVAVILAFVLLRELIGEIDGDGCDAHKGAEISVGAERVPNG